MKTLNKRGPWIDPFATPRSILHHSLKYIFPLKCFQQITVSNALDPQI